MVESKSISITPAEHADRHIIGGADPLINPLLLHSSRHEIGGDDELTSLIIESYASDTIRNSNDSGKSTDLVPYQLLKETLIAGVSGIARVKFKLAASGTTATGRIYVNDVAVGTVRTQVGAGSATYSEDITVASGDKIQIYGHQSGGGHTVTISELRIYFDRTLGTFTNQDP